MRGDTGHRRRDGRATTFNTTLVFPAANTEQDMGAVSNTHAEPGYVMTLAVTNGAAANPGPFLVLVDYV